MPNVKKTTLADSPEASRILTEIQPNEVSLVDTPANGEPFVIVKRNGGDMPTKIEKYDHTQVPRVVMKAIDSRLRGTIESVNELADVTKRMPAAEDGNNVNAPAMLVSMVKSIAGELRSLQSYDAVPVAKRGFAESIMPVHELVRKAEFIDSIDKQNAVSYLMRDQYVNVTTSVNEWLTTFIDGIETDDDGPMLIPVDLNEGVDKSASQLENLAEEYPPLDQEEEPNAEEEVSKLHQELQSLKSALKSAKNITDVEKKGSKMAADRLNVLKNVSSSVSDAAHQLSEIIKNLEDHEELEEGDEMTTEKTVEESDVTKAVSSESETTETQESTQEPVQESNESIQKNANGDTVTNDALMAALTKFATDTETRFAKFDERLDSVEKASTKTSEEVEKIHRLRGDPRGGESDTTTTVEKTVDKAPSSFHNLLGIPKDI